VLRCRAARLTTTAIVATPLPAAWPAERLEGIKRFFLLGIQLPVKGARRGQLIFHPLLMLLHAIEHLFHALRGRQLHHRLALGSHVAHRSGLLADRIRPGLPGGFLLGSQLQLGMQLFKALLGKLSGGAAGALHAGTAAWAVAAEGVGAATADKTDGDQHGDEGAGKSTVFHGYLLGLRS